MMKIIIRINDISTIITVKCAMDHPHHVLPKVLALVNAFKDEEFLDQSLKSSSPRTDAASKVLSTMKQNDDLRAIIVQMERMCAGNMLDIHFKRQFNLQIFTISYVSVDSIGKC